MRKRREKIVQIIIASTVTLVLSYGLFLATNTNAKEVDSPGQKIKQIVHHYNNLRKSGDYYKEAIKQEAKEQKKEVIAEVKGTNAEIQDNVPASPDDITVTPLPTIKPLSITPRPTIALSPVPTVIDPHPTSEPIFNACTESGGTWREFPNSCGDSCALIEHPGQIMCLDVMREACDCGPSACWNGNTCVSNPSVQGTRLPTPTIEVPPPIDGPVCGNGICEAGEEGTYHCPVCKQGVEPCPYHACLHQPGTCQKDCLMPIAPIF